MLKGSIHFYDLVERPSKSVFQLFLHGVLCVVGQVLVGHFLEAFCNLVPNLFPLSSLTEVYHESIESGRNIRPLRLFMSQIICEIVIRLLDLSHAYVPEDLVLLLTVYHPCKLATPRYLGRKGRFAWLLKRSQVHVPPPYWRLHFILHVLLDSTSNTVVTLLCHFISHLHLDVVSDGLVLEQSELIPESLKVFLVVHDVLQRLHCHIYISSSV